MTFWKRSSLKLSGVPHRSVAASGARWSAHALLRGPTGLDSHVLTSPEWQEARFEEPRCSVFMTTTTDEDDVRAALAIPTDHWPGLALDWLDQGVPATDLIEELGVFEQERRRPQDQRHHARRLRKAARAQ